jgi:hypothetical protein
LILVGLEKSDRFPLGKIEDLEGFGGAEEIASGPAEDVEDVHHS